VAVYKYTTIVELREEGITEAAVPDARAAKLIARVSEEVNGLTDQWFTPIAKRYQLDGGGGSLILCEIPVLKVDQLEVLSSRTKDPGIARVGAVEPSYVVGLPSELPTFDDRYSAASPFSPGTLAPDFTIDDRKIRALAPIPPGVNNVQVDGIFGWTENRQVFETVLAEALAPDATYCVVTDASGVRRGHVVSFTTGTGPGSRTEFTAWVLSVEGNKINFVDPAADLDVTLAADTTRVGDYGTVPAAIQQATIRLVNRQKSGVGTPGFSEEEFFGRLKREKTDNYEYQLAAQVEVTGDDLVNTLLNKYVRPPFVGLA
jgi:hypothetical protein